MSRFLLGIWIFTSQNTKVWESESDSPIDFWDNAMSVNILSTNGSADETKDSLYLPIPAFPFGIKNPFLS